MDSLLFTLLMGMLTGIGQAMPVDQGQFAGDSVTITVSIRVTETIEFETEIFEIMHENWQAVIKASRAKPYHIVSRSPGQALKLRGVFGLGGTLGEDVGYVSVADRDGPAGWIFRNAVVESLDNNREADLRFSLVRNFL